MANPLPLGASGALFNLANLTTGYGMGSVRRARDLSNYLFNAGLTSALRRDQRNPFSRLAQIDQATQQQSADAGFGYSGRVQQQMAEPQRFAAFRDAQQAIQGFGDAEQDARFDLNQGMSQQALNAARFGVDNRMFTIPRMRYQAKGGAR